jgi:hypothetical protein
MTTLPGNPTPNQDDSLADFADRARMDSSAKLEFSSDEELRGLEETLLRLNRAFPRDAMNEETVKRMQADFGIRKRRQAAQDQASRQKWLSALFQSPVALAVAAFIVIGVLAFLAPSLTAIGSSTSGTAGTQAKPIGFLLILGMIIILLALWSGRRK